MEHCNYDEINTKDDDERAQEEKITWTPLLRQIFVISGPFSLYFVLGMGFGAPTVVIPQIRKEANSTEAVSDSMASWLTSIHGYSALPWVFVVSVLTKYLGRKLPFILISLNTVASFILFYFSSNTTQLLISAIMLGMLLASNMTLFVLIVTECSSPRYRGIFMIFKDTLFYLGLWVSNATGVFAHWKNIGIIALASSLFSLTVFFWPESPYWLAMKGRFEECAVSHHWLKGFGKESEFELKTLIDSQKDYLKTSSERRNTMSWTRIIELLSTKAYYMPLLVSILIISIFQFSGKMVCSMYAIDLLTQTMGSEELANVGMLVMDSVTILGMQVGCVLSKFLKRRTLFLSSALMGIIILFILSIYLFLTKFEIITENVYVSLTLLTLFSVSISAGPMIMSSALFGELVSLRYRTSSFLILTLCFEFLMASVLKIAPSLFRLFTLPGAFLFYAVSSSVFCFLLYIYLPETKDKTLFEIENLFTQPKKSKDAENRLLDNKSHNVD